MSHGQDELLKQQAARLERRAALLADRVALLEQENDALASRLRECGVEVHHRRRDEGILPEPLTAPSPDNAAEEAMLTRRERVLFDELCGSDRVRVLLLSESMADVGRWLIRGRVWVCATDTELVAFAAGWRPLMQRIPYRHIQESLYNMITGELVLAPNYQFAVNRIRLSPLEAYQMLAQIYAAGRTGGSQENSHA